MFIAEINEIKEILTLNSLTSFKKLFLAILEI